MWRTNFSWFQTQGIFCASMYDIDRWIIVSYTLSFGMKVKRHSSLESIFAMKYVHTSFLPIFQDFLSWAHLFIYQHENKTLKNWCIWYQNFEIFLQSYIPKSTSCRYAYFMYIISVSLILPSFLNIGCAINFSFLGRTFLWKGQIAVLKDCPEDVSNNGKWV